jgi:hypothetical protein
VWDVVDTAILGDGVPDDDLDRPAGALPPRKETKAKETVQTGSHTLGMLDASTVDVYRGAQVVVLVFDPRKTPSFYYVENALRSVPKDKWVVVLVNFR